MSEESRYIIHSVHDALSEVDARIVGPLKLTDELLTAFDGQLLIQGEARHDPSYHPSIAHCHIISKIGRTSFTDPLEACVMGLDADRKLGFEKAARNWVTSVSCVLFSLLHAKPVMDAVHFDGRDAEGVRGCHGFMGPIQGFNVLDPEPFKLLLNTPLFDYADAFAPAGTVHLAKAVVEAQGAKGWKRTLEIDGHAASFEEAAWDCGIAAPESGIISRFAVFHYADQPEAVESRRTLDDGIRQFVATVGTTRDLDAATDALRDNNVPSEVAQRIAMFAPLAFSRVMLDGMGVTFSNEYKRITKEGICDTEKLMREPAFARSIGLFRELISGHLSEATKAIAISSSTFKALNNALNAGSKPTDLVMSPTFIPDADAGQAAIEQALRSVSARRVDADLAAIEQALSSSKQPAPNATTRQKASKPWWRLW